MVEIFIEIPQEHKSTLESLIGFPLLEPLNYKHILATLTERAKRDSVDFYKYLNKIYCAFPKISNCLGGESRDIINRVRKFSRADGQVQEKSKFKESSLYYLYQQGLSLLKNVRSSHSDYEKSIVVHATFIVALIGTSQLTIEDWVLESAKPVVDKNSKLYKYICESGLWNSSHVLYNSLQ
jgi:hypothetical protein